MGVNGQKRKKKQGPVPSLEESLPKKFKSEKHVKPKKGEKPAKSNGLGGAKVGTKQNKRRVQVDAEEVEGVVGEAHRQPLGEQDFGTTKNSLFDGSEDDGDEFGDLEGDVDMYNYQANLILIFQERRRWGR